MCGESSQNLLISDVGMVITFPEGHHWMTDKPSMFQVEVTYVYVIYYIYIYIYWISNIPIIVFIHQVNLPIFGISWDTLVIRIDFPHRQPGGLAGGSAAGGGHHCLDRRPRGSPERAAKHQRRQRRAAWYCGGNHQLIGGKHPTFAGF